MEMIPIAGGALAFVGLVMMAVAAVMLARGSKRQVKVVIPTSTAGKMPPPAREVPRSVPPPPPSPAQPKPTTPKPEPPKPEAPNVAPPPPPQPAPLPPKAAEPKPPAPPVPEPVPDPRVSEEGTRIAMIPPPEPVGPPPPPPPPEEATVAQPIPTAPAPEVAEEAPQSTIAISPGDMDDFRTVVEKAAPKSYGSLVGISGGMEGREIRIDEEGFVIGRDQRTAQLVISDPRISKRHVWVGVREGEVWAVDVGSTNGSYLNVPRSQRITEVRLNPGDILILAEDAARFEYRKA